MHREILADVPGCFHGCQEMATDDRARAGIPALGMDGCWTPPQPTYIPPAASVATAFANPSTTFAMRA